MNEAVLQRLIIARLNQLEGVVVWRMNTGVARAGDRFVRFGLPGQADITGLVRMPDGRGIRVEIECKSDKGRVRPDQEEFGRAIHEAGGLYVVARTLDDATGPVQALLRGEAP